MTELFPAVTSLTLAEIEEGSRLRPVSPAAVEALIHVIAEHGFTVPIVVRRVRSGWRLIDGAHRLEAMRRRGEATIPVRAYSCTETEARSLEASQNLAGASLSPLDDALFLAAYSRAYQDLHPETKRGTAGSAARWDATELSSFASVIAEKRAITPRQVRKIVAAGARLHATDADLLRQAPRKVTLKDLEQIGRIDDSSERSAVMKALAAGEAKSAAEARRRLKLEREGAPPAADEAEKALQSLLNTWSRAPMAARRRFVDDRRDDLAELLGGADE